MWHPTFDLFLGNYDVFRPYSWLFTYNYGSGFNAYNLSLDGYLRDAWFLGSRVDYAVAANLNVYGTFLLGGKDIQRVRLGCHRSFQHVFPPADLTFSINGAAGSPNIPDRSLGWEVNAGFDWQLLEGFTVGFSGRLLAAGQMVQLRVHRQIGSGMECTYRSEQLWNST